MIRSILALVVLSLFAADASACGRAGLFRGRVREHTRIVHRERHVQRGSCAAASGVVFPVARAVVTGSPCGILGCSLPLKK